MAKELIHIYLYNAGKLWSLILKKITTYLKSEHLSIYSTSLVFLIIGQMLFYSFNSVFPAELKEPGPFNYGLQKSFNKVLSLFI